MICNNIVDKDFCESSCCGTLCCAGCMRKERSKNYYSRNVIKCFNKSCDTPHTTMTWREASKFINAQIDNLTTTHECGKRVDNEELKKHLLICQKLIIGCFKCKGIGKYSMVEGTEIQFNSCYGRKVLQGVDWRECFKSCC